MEVKGAESGKEKKQGKSRKKVGKLVEGRAKEKRGSIGGLEEFLRKKRNGRMEKEGEEGNIFRDSKKTPRSPTGRKGEDLEGIIREWSQEIKQVLEEIRGLKGIKEEMVKMKEDIKEKLREQGAYVSREGNKRADGRIREKNGRMGQGRREGKENRRGGNGKENQK